MKHAKSELVVKEDEALTEEIEKSLAEAKEGKCKSIDELLSDARKKQNSESKV